MTYPVVSDLSTDTSNSNTPNLTSGALRILLKKRGVSDKDIEQFLNTGTPTAQIVATLSPGQIQQVLGAKATNPARTLTQPMGPPPKNPFGSAGFGSVAQGMLYGSNPADRGVSAPPINPATQVAQMGSGVQYGDSSYLNQQKSAPVYGGGGSQTPEGPAYVDPNPQKNSFGGAYGTQEGAPGGPPIGSSAQSPMPELPGYPTAPPVTTFTPPDIQRKDFTQQANGLAASAYAPFFQSIDQGKGNAQAQYNTSADIVKGLYDSLVNDVNKSGQQQAAQYDKSAQQAVAGAQDTQKQQKGIYDQTAQDQAKLMAQLGQQQSAADVLGQTGAASSFQQAETANQGNAQKQYYQEGKQAAQDQTTGTANASRTSGTVAREDLVRQLSDVLSAFDQQAAQGKTQEATTALDLGNTLSSQDLQNQQSNVQNQLSAFGANTQAQQQGFANQTGAWNAQYQALSDQQKLAMQAQQAAQDQSNQDRNYGLQAGQLDLQQQQYMSDAANAQATFNAKYGQQSQQGGTGAIAPDQQGYSSQSSPQKVIATAESIDPGKGAQYLALFNSLVNGKDYNSYNTQTFAQTAADNAQNAGLSPAAAYAAATTFWNDVMNRK